MFKNVTAKSILSPPGTLKGHSSMKAKESYNKPDLFNNSEGKGARIDSNINQEIHKFIHSEVSLPEFAPSVCVAKPKDEIRDQIIDSMKEEMNKQIDAKKAKQNWIADTNQKFIHKDDKNTKSHKLRGNKGVTYSSPINQVASKLFNK